jgi:hypothetical protein
MSLRCMTFRNSSINLNESIINMEQLEIWLGENTSNKTSYKWKMKEHSDLIVE